jgi:hypothetical protein
VGILLPDLSALAVALSSLNAAKDIAQAMIGLRDSKAFQTKLLEFQAKLLDANRATFAAQDERHALLERISTLEKEVAGLKAWEAEKQRYELKPLGTGVAYAVKQEAQGTEPPHQLCANCYAAGKKSFLARVPTNAARQALGMGTVYRCSVCRSEI